MRGICVCVCVWEILASLGLKVGDAVHDDVMEEQRLVVDLDVSGQQAAKVLHIPDWTDGEKQRGLKWCPVFDH